MMRSGPHQTTIGKRDARQVATAALRVSGQPNGGPNGERDQSCARMRAPMLPPPSRKPKEVVPAIDMHIPPSALQLSNRSTYRPVESRTGHGETKLGHGIGPWERRDDRRDERSYP